MAGRFPIPSVPSSIRFSRCAAACGFRGRTVRVAFWTVVASSRDDVLDLADKHHDATAFDRAATLAWTQGQVQLSHLGVDPDQANLFQRLAGHVLYADPSLRPSSEVIRRGGGAPAALWAQAFPATSRSFSCGSTTSRRSPLSASCCAPTNTGA